MSSARSIDADNEASQGSETRAAPIKPGSQAGSVLANQAAGEDTALHSSSTWKKPKMSDEEIGKIYTSF